MTSPFPINIRKTTLQYKRGSSDKEYHLVTIGTSQGRAILIKRWGKSGTWGQMDVHLGDPIGIDATRNNVYREKTGKGYEQTHEAAQRAADLDELDRILPGYRRKLTVDQIDYLVPGTSTSGTRPGYVPSSPPKPAGPPPPPPPTEAERYADNPRWGAFS